VKTLQHSRTENKRESVCVINYIVKYCSLFLPLRSQTEAVLPREIDLHFHFEGKIFPLRV
jgi:hypothetical protein